MRTFRFFTVGGDILVLGDGVRNGLLRSDTIEVYALPDVLNPDGTGKPLEQIQAGIRTVVVLYKDRVIGWREEGDPGSAVMALATPQVI